MVDCALEHAACYGARMTGAGFGGCAVALVHSDSADDFAAQISESYENQTQIKPNVYICYPTNGAEVLIG
jgi:galactokinase